MEPQIQYATASDGVSIAYYAIGRGPVELFLMLPWSNLTAEWDIEALRQQYTAAARRWTFVRLDPRGFGLSDRDPPDFEVDSMVRDIAAVVHKLGPSQVRIYALGLAVIPALAFTARHLESVTHLVLASPITRGQQNERLNKLRELAEIDWELATNTMVRSFNPKAPEELVRDFGALMRASLSKETFVRFISRATYWDVDADAASVTTPTLLLHQRDNPNTDIAETRRVAGVIKNSRVAFITSPLEAGVYVQRFFMDQPIEIADPSPERPDRVPAGTAVILFLDIADSTALTTRLGDAAYREKERALDGMLRAAITDAGGTPVEGKVLGDGVMAVFSSARQAIDAARACRDLGDKAGLPLHLGIHAGDVVREGNNVHGGAVQVASRVVSAAAPGEILVSQTVRDLARTSAGVAFEDRGEHELKGIEEPVRVWAVRERA